MQVGPRWAAAGLTAVALGACKRTATPVEGEAVRSTAASSSSAVTSASSGAFPGASAPRGSGSAASASPLATGIVREQTSLLVDGVAETWRLEWKRPPFPTCRGEDAKTCACAGFTPGERGDLALVRVRPGAADERLELSPLFDGHEAIVASGSPDASAPALTFADYDHDGRATELVFQVGAGPCGHTASVLIGVAKANPHLHVFSSVEDPSAPLTLEQRSDWETIRTTGALEAVQVPCGDHGAEESTSVVVRAAAGVLHASTKTSACRH